MADEFKQRLDKYYDELKWLYCELYENRLDELERLCSNIYGFYDERKTELKDLDRKRSADPNWYKTGGITGMMMYTDAFAGNLKGVADELDYIEECGVNYLHLMPLLDSPEGRSDGGYAVSDFRRVNPKLGTMEDLEQLAEKCHKRGISVCLDFVMNHTSEDHEWARRARAGEWEYQNRYFFFNDYGIPAMYERTVPQVFPVTAPGNFTYNHETGKFVMTTFYPYQWDLNYSNPVVLSEMIYNMLFLINKGIDVIRIDAVPYIWKQLGTSCRNLPQVHSIVRIMRIICEIVCPGVLLLGEVVMEPDKVVPYFGSPEKPECHMLYNVTTMAATWHTAATKDVRLLRRQLDIVNSLPKEYVFLNYLRCHDDIGWGLDYDWLKRFGISERSHKNFLNDFFTGEFPYSYGRGELYNSDPLSGDARLCGTTASLCGIEKAEYERDEYALDRAVRFDLTLHAYMLSMSGIPVIYSGDEIAQLNDYSYHGVPSKRADSRYIHRGAFNRDNAAKRGDTSTVQGRMFTGLKKLIDTRKKSDLFACDAAVYTIDTGSDSLLGVVREKNGKRLTELYSFSNEDIKAYLSRSVSGKDLISGKKISGKEIDVPAFGSYWILENIK